MLIPQSTLSGQQTYTVHWFEKNNERMWSVEVQLSDDTLVGQIVASVIDRFNQEFKSKKEMMRFVGEAEKFCL